MNDAMLWTVIGTFVAAMTALVGGTLYVMTLHLRHELSKALGPIERDLHDLTRDMRDVKARLDAAGA